MAQSSRHIEPLLPAAVTPAAISGTAAATSAATLAVTAESAVPLLSAAALSSATLAISASGAALIAPNASDAISATTLALSAKSEAPLNTSAAASATTLALSAKPTVALATSPTTSAATLALTASAPAMIVIGGTSRTHISSRKGGIHPGGGTTTPTSCFSNGTITWQNSRVKHLAYYAGSNIKLVYVNGCDDLTDANHNSVTVRAGFEYPGGTIEKVLWSGVDNVTLTPGQMITSDALAGSLAANDTFWVRTNANVASTGMKWAFTEYSQSSQGEGGAGGTGTNSNLAWSGTIAAAFSKGLSAVEVRADGPASPCVLVIGDSIEYGAQETEAGEATRGYIGKALSGVVPHVRLSLGSEAAYQFLTDKAERQAIIDLGGITDVIVGHPRNDLRDSRTLAQCKTALSSIYSLFSTPIRVWGTLSPPYSVTSTDAFTTIANQTQSNTTRDDIRLSVNTWIVAGADGLLAGYFDTGGTVTAAGLGGRIWDVNPSAVAITSDGIHPNLAGHTRMAAAIDTSRFTASGGAAATSAATLALTAHPPAMISPNTSAAHSSATMALKAKPTLAPSASDATSSATLSLTDEALLALISDALSSATLSLAPPTQLDLAAAAQSDASASLSTTFIVRLEELLPQSAATLELYALTKRRRSVGVV